MIFEAAGVPALLAHATSQLSPAGRLVAMTFGKEPIPVNFKEINAKELTILGTRHQYQKFPEVVKILPDHLKEVDEGRGLPEGIRYPCRPQQRRWQGGADLRLRASAPYIIKR